MRSALLVVLCLLASACTPEAGDELIYREPPVQPRRGQATEEYNYGPGDRVFFATDQSDLSEEARRTLERQARFLAFYPSIKVQIEGHADERGTLEYNLALGQRRAAAVQTYLIALGVAAERLSLVSYGKERPAALGSGDAVWRQNRRAVSLFILDASVPKNILPGYPR